MIKWDIKFTTIIITLLAYAFGLVVWGTNLSNQVSVLNVQAVLQAQAAEINNGKDSAQEIKIVRLETQYTIISESLRQVNSKLDKLLTGDTYNGKL